MVAYSVDAVSVVPAAVHPYDVRYTVLSEEERQQNHMAVGMNGEKYLAVHPTYSLSPPQYHTRILVAVLLVLLEVDGFLLLLLGLCRPCFTVNDHMYVAFDGGYDGYGSGSSGRKFSVSVPSTVVVIFMLFSCICPVFEVRRIPSDQAARMGEEALNKELLVMYNVQVQGDGRVHSAFGEASVVKEDCLCGPCCGFEANEYSRLLRNKRLSGVQCLVEAIGVILQSIIAYNMSSVYSVAVARKDTVAYNSGYHITLLAVLLRLVLFLFYFYASIGLCFRESRRLPRCQLVPVFGNRVAAALISSGEVVEDGYPCKPPQNYSNREELQEMTSMPGPSGMRSSLSH